MNYLFKSSFDRCYKKLTPKEQLLVDNAIDDLMYFFRTGQQKAGLGLKQLRSPFWEIRATLKIRILFLFGNGEISFSAVGSHDDIRRFLKNV